ncbi:MAG: hypothetical protein WA347_00750 [Rhabdochlamydiaceae bacterium]|jgi:hypothetical protein
MTAADVHDSRILGSVVTVEESWVFADKVYDTEADGKLALREKK